MAGTIDFTRGSIVKNIALFALPIVGSELLQDLYNIVDALVVGNFVGGEALAAVSVCSAIAQLVVGFFNGMSVGASVLASRYFGAGKAERLSAALRNGFAFSVVLGAALSIIGVFSVPWLLRMIAVPHDVFGQAALYLRIYLAGMFFTVVYNVAAGLLRAIGDSRGPLYVLMVACVLNIVLDVLFVAVFRMGVAGAGFATVISQSTSAVAGYFLLKKRDSGFWLTLKELYREKKMIGTVVNIGMPAGLQASLVSFSNLFVWRYVSGFNAAAMAGIGVTQRIDKCVSMPCRGFGLAITTFVSQNIGAGKRDRIDRGVRGCLAMSLAYCVGLCVVLYLSAEFLVGFFSDVPEVIAVGVGMMHVVLPFYFLLAIRDIYLGVLRSWGDSQIPMYLSLLGMVGVRQLYLAIALGRDHRIIHVFIGYPLAWGATALLVGGYYLIRRRHYRIEDVELR